MGPARTGRPATTAPTATEWVAVTGVAAAGAALLLDPSSVDDGPVICPFRLLTGLPCPGCGLTRSWVHLVHGDPVASWAAHPFGPLLLGLVVALGVTVVVARRRDRPAPDLDRLVRQRWLQVVVAAWLVFAAVRLGLAL